MEAKRLGGLVESYVAAWNETAPSQRSAALTALYSPTASVVTQSGKFDGVDAIVDHITKVNDEFVASGRFRFQSGGALSHHSCVLFRWELVNAGDGGLADAGMNLFLLAPDGRIQGDYQFVLGVNSSIGHLAVAR